MNRFIRVISYVLAFAVIALIVPQANAQATYGSASGIVRDSTGAVIVGATVTATNTSIGTKLSVVSNSVGRWVFPSLSVGVYDISIEASGFKKTIHTHVTVDVASPVLLNVTLVPGTAEQQVEVSADVPMIEKADAALGGITDGRQLHDLPINGRDYARFSLLVPGAVARSSYIADLSFDGLHSVHNQFSIDGVDASRVDQPYMANGYERGARMLTGSMESISEFKVQTSGYQAEYGRAAGSLVNIVTKSGGNNYHGEVFEYFRNDALDANNYFVTDKPEFRYNDFGGNIGGPLYKHKTFFFTNYEASRQLLGVPTSGTVPSSTVRAEVLAQSPELQPVLDIIPVGVDRASDPDTADYSTSGISNVREDTGTVRIDHHFAQNDSLFGRMNINDTYVHGPLYAVSSSAFGVNDKQDVPIRTTNVGIGHQHIFTPSVLNNALVGLQRWASIIGAKQDVPRVYFGTYTIAPGDEGLYAQVGNSYQFGDSLSWVKGHHTFKFGGNAYRIQVNRYSNASTYMSFTTVDDFINNRLAYAGASASDPGHGTRATQFGIYAQDSFQAAHNLQLNYGLRWDMETVPHDKDYKTQSYNPLTGELFNPGEPYFKGNHADFSPRVGVVYSPTPRTVVRSAFGIFYQAYPVGFGAYSVPMNNIAGNYYLTQGDTPGLSYPFTSYVTNTSTPSTVYGFPTHKPDIYSEQWNLSFATELTNTWALQLAYVGNHGINLWREMDVNYYGQGYTPRPNSNFGDIYLEANNGFTVYHGFQASLMRRAGHGLYFQGNYTYGHVIDNVQDQGLFASEPQDNNNIAAERGNGSGDVRHNFTYSVVYDIPMGEGHSFLGTAPAPVRVLASGWQANSLGLVRTGVAFNVTQSVNTYGNGDYTNQRPNYSSTVNPYLDHKGPSGWLNGAAWSLPVDGTFGNSPRNGWYGPGLTQFDASLIKNTKLGEGRDLEFRSEFFNIFNHPNFGQPYSTYGSSSFGQIFTTINRTIGTGTQRQIQFALKLHF
ncbi:MAG TPA: TonB-dependent receptor [Terracidiphilus sp.]|nr:TonB-dependent receptor [Terracidiphilus sp.]